MKKAIYLFIAVCLFSCSEKNERKSAKAVAFQKIPYDLKFNYFDSLGLKISPVKKYDYWQYATYNDSFADTSYKVIKEGGDSSLKEKIKPITNVMDPVGIFQGGHPNYRCNYVVTIKDGVVNYIQTEEGFRDFLGTIDNLEEGLLLARTYGYFVDDNPSGSEYRKIGNVYEFHLMKNHEFPYKKERIEIRISPEGYIRTKSLGIFSSGKSAYR